MTGLNLRPRTVSRNGNIRCCHAEGPGFESCRDQSLNDVGPLVESNIWKKKVLCRLAKKMWDGEKNASARA